MKLCTVPALKRVGIALIVCAVAGAFAVRHMCRCGGRATGAPEPMNASADNLKTHVVKLAGEIGERNLWTYSSLTSAASYIESVWVQQGYEVSRHGYRVENLSVDNLEITVPGKTSEIILAGAHYDTVEDCPGANDNGTGVASLLELSRLLKGFIPHKTIRLVAFVNEEPPFFQTDLQGSRVYARMARERGDNITAMYSLETMGYYSDEAGSQHYPSLFRFVYPDKGNFIGFVSNLKSRPLLQQSVKAFRTHTSFPAECCATFAQIPGVGWSDHWSFWQEGYPGVMITDTAPFRYAHYHTRNDTPDKVNYEALAKVTDGVLGMVRDLASSTR